MVQSYTQDTLVRFLYRETSAAETDAIERALDIDFELRERFETLKASAEALDCRMASPSARTLDNLLRYSRSTAPIETAR